MLQDSILFLIDTDRYLDISRSMYPQVECLILRGAVDDDLLFKSIHSQSSNGSQASLGDLKQIDTHFSSLEPIDLDSGVASFWFIDENNIRCYTKNLKTATGDMFGTLCVCMNSKAIKEDPKALLNLDLLAEMLEYDYQLNIELHAITLELTDRYEELNLIYGTEDDSDHFKQSHKLLADLVLQCSERMEVSASLLYLPTQDVLILEEANIPEGASTSVAEFVEDQLISWAQDIGEAFVVNSAFEADADIHCPALQRKMVCSPITNLSDEVCGIVAVFCGYDSPDFSNSDRNLVRILAGKASRVIRSNYDELTSLTNRHSFEYLLGETTNKLQGVDSENSCLLLVNLRGLHVVNDTCGDVAGDALIINVATLLTNTLSDSCHVSRIDGGVFGIVMNDIAIDSAKNISLQIMASINAMDFVWEGHEFQTNVSMGLVQLTARKSPQEQIANARIALHVARDKGNNIIEIQRHDNEDIERRRTRIKMLNLINDALKHDKFELYCQGIYAVNNTNIPHHYEILLRYRDDDGNIHSPYKFIEAAEYYKVMPDVDRWVIHKALKMIGDKWPQLAETGIGWAINLSGQTFTQHDLLNFISVELGNSPIDPKKIAFEVTETVAVENLLEARETIERVKKLGCEFYLDDFGTGLSSFTYLCELPFDHVKIDGSFIKKICDDKVANAMVKAIADVAHVLGMKTVGEFVENKEIAQELRILGVEYIQGYGYHKPEPLKDILLKVSSHSKASV